MSNLVFTDGEMKVRHDDGTLSTAPSIPFQQYSFLRLRWVPICIKHKLWFSNESGYQEHWTTICEDYDHRECPASNYLFKLKGYHRG